MQKKILVSIINWNNTKATNACLQSIASIQKSKQPDIYLIDNDSKLDPLNVDSSVVDSLKSIKVTENNENKGFAGGHNDAIRYAVENGYKYICLLNNDTEIIDGSVFDKLCNSLEKSESAVAANPTILHTIEPPTIWYGGGTMNVGKASAHHNKVGELMDDKASGMSEDVSFLTGCCLMISLKDTSIDLLLSEDYFLYWEDADWCARMLQNGKILLYVPDATVLHNTSSSLGVRSPSYSYYNLRNRLLFAKRWSSVVEVLPSTVLTATKIFILSFKKPATLPKTFWYIVRAFWDGLTNKTGPIS